MEGERLVASLSMPRPPYRTAQNPVALDEEADITPLADSLFPILAIVWLASAIRVLGAVFSAVHEGHAFGAEATLALAAFVGAPIALLRTRVRG
jgi:hypothetical protein